MELGTRLFERLQQRVRGLGTEDLRPGNTDDAPRALVRLPGSERDRLAHAVDPDLDPFRLDVQEIGVKGVERAAAGLARSIRISSRTEHGRRYAERLFFERAFRWPVKKERSRETTAYPFEPPENRRGRRGAQTPNLSDSADQVSRKSNAAG